MAAAVGGMFAWPICISGGGCILIFFIAGGCLEIPCFELAPVYFPPKQEVEGGFCIAKLDRMRLVEEYNHFCKRIINLKNTFLVHDNFT
jgi:hypothetical protein